MITLSLRMRYGEKPLRQAAAWLIPGAEPRSWLDEMLAWGVPLENAALYLIPRSAGDLSPQGVLVVLPAGLAPRVTHRSQPYAALALPQSGGIATGIPPKGGATSAAHVVYLPIEARFDPDASDAEVARLAADQGDCLLHPTAGRIGLEAGDRRSVADVLVAPRQRAARWDRAEPGQRVNARLTAIVPVDVPSLQEMLDKGRDDIGSESPTLDALPPEPGEPSQGFFSKLGRSLQRKLADMIEKLAGGSNPPPQSGAGQGSAAGNRLGKPGMFSQMANWARQKMAQLDDALRKSRHRELHRLMNLLKNDPDQGLRFALPCGEGKHRGIARPSDTLASHNVNFDLRRLGGGAAGDPWELPADLYAQLRARYMELAGREMRLGRYRRAAYIYAHLLGDFTNAAAALTAGKHWREAAALYRDRLKRPEMAAKCLEQGGLWAEAMEFYEQLGDFEKVGDLHAQLQQPEEAEKAWRRTVDKFLGRCDNLSAARLLETKLKLPDEALEVLAAAWWPVSLQAGACLAEQFALLGRLGRHDAAARRVVELRQEPLREAVRARAIDVLVDNARGYPHESVRKAAADAARTIIARHLREAAGRELDHLLKAIARLEPADRLLERDTARYLRQRTQPPPVAKPTPVRSVVPAPHLPPELNRLESIRLPGDVKWECAASCASHFYAAGFRDRQLCLVECTWGGRTRMVERNVSELRPILFAYRAKWNAVLGLIGQPSVVTIAFPPDDLIPDGFLAHSPGFLAENTVAVQMDASGIKHVLDTTDDGLVLNTLDSNNAPTRSQLITYDSLWPEESVAFSPVVPAPMCARDTGVYIGLGDRLVLVRGGKTPENFVMPGLVQSLCGSMSYSVPRVVATLEQGAALFLEESWTTVRFAETLDHPLAAFTAGGWIVLASSAELQVYKTAGRSIQLATRQNREGRPIAVLATGHPNGFAIVGEDGLVEQFRMPQR